MFVVARPLCCCCAIKKKKDKKDSLSSMALLSPKSYFKMADRRVKFVDRCFSLELLASIVDHETRNDDTSLSSPLIRKRLRQQTTSSFLFSIFIQTLIMTSVEVPRGNKAPKDDEQVNALITDLRKEFVQRLDVLQAEYVASKNKQQQVLASGMVKLNKNIKSMTVREFNALYKCNLLQLVQAVRENNNNNSANTSSPSKKRDRGMTAETPSHQGIKLKQPQSASRTVRRGEALL